VWRCLCGGVSGPVGQAGGTRAQGGLLTLRGKEEQNKGGGTDSYKTK